MGVPSCLGELRSEGGVGEGRIDGRIAMAECRL
jgi:hypothetical protein